jgi:hypothetical protein
MTRYELARRVMALVTLVSFFTACYAQRPLSVAVPAPATRIVAQVTDTGAVVMGSAIGPGVVEVEGVVAEADATTWKLQVVRVEQRGGISTPWNREVVSFPRNALTSPREKRLDRTRSWLMAGLVVAGLVAVAVLFGPVLGGGDSDPGPVPPA